ncbi:MAG: hypothetical protein GF350_14730 [Chitinivibrionales bacterium]|nr:hypothetical protein [Chitinivibrionales bacterium]
MRLLKTFACYFMLFAVFSGSTCPTTDDPLPPRLSAPSFTAMEVSSVKQGDRYHPALCMSWTPPPQDSNSVRFYYILRNAVNFNDTLYSIVRHSIPREITSYCDRIDQFGYPSDGIKEIGYRICALDTAGQTGDTADVRSFFLAGPPFLQTPHADDTLNKNLFEWSMRGIFGQYRTFMLFWDSDTLLWKSVPESTYGGEKSDLFSAMLPDTLIDSLHPGTCHWGAKVEALSLPYQQSMDIRSLYVLE